MPESFGGFGSDFGTWAADGTRLVICYSYAITDEIRLDATEKFLSIPRGGIEVGGVLFGTIEGDRITILARRPLAIEYKNGPSFVLSEADQDNLRRLLDSCDSDSGLQALEPVGWYHSHTRSDVFLSVEDVATHQKFFPGLRQVALVVRPAKLQPTRSGFFVREDNGGIRADASYREFFLERNANPAEPPLALAVQPAHTVFLPPPVTLPEALPARSGVSRNKAAVVLAILLVIAALAFVAQRGSPPVAANVPAGIRLTGSGDHLVVEWNQSNDNVRQSSHGSLDIFDGAAGKVSIPLDRDSLRKGSATYASRSQTVEVRLRLYAQHRIMSESVAHYVKPASLPAVTPSPVAAPDNSLPEPSPTAAVPTPEVPMVSERTRSVERPRQAILPPTSTRPIARALTDVGPAPQISVSAPAASPIALPRAAPPPPPRTQPSPAAAPARTLGSGRALWTGELRKGGVLMIDGGRPSSGTLSGTIPARSVRIAPYPAELIDGGMQVYTASPTPPVSEPPSARNGWNLTFYRSDAKRFHEIDVLESPSEKNNWRLLLRANTRTVGIVVLDWQEIASSN